MPTLVLDEPEKKTKGPRLVLDEPPAQAGSFIDDLPEDPYEQEKILRDVINTATELEIGINDAEDNYKYLNDYKKNGYQEEGIKKGLGLLASTFPSPFAPIIGATIARTTKEDIAGGFMEAIRRIEFRRSLTESQGIFKGSGASGDWLEEQQVKYGPSMRALKGFEKSFVDTLAILRTKSSYGKSMTGMSVFGERIRAAKDAGLLKESDGIKQFLKLPDEQIDKLFGGETIEEHYQRRELERGQRTAGYASTRLTPAEGYEVLIDAASNVAAFITKLAVIKKILGPADVGRNLTAWELTSQADGETPGKGTAMFLALRGIDEIPIKGVKGFVAKTTSQSGLFAGLAYASGGDRTEITVAALLPWALRAYDAVAKGTVKVTRSLLEKRTVKGLRELGKENGIDLSEVPDNTLVFISQQAKQARFWNKQYQKGKINQNVLNMRLDNIRHDVEPALQAIARQQTEKTEPIVTPEETQTRKEVQNLIPKEAELREFRKNTGIPFKTKAEKQIAEEEAQQERHLKAIAAEGKTKVGQPIKTEAEKPGEAEEPEVPTEAEKVLSKREIKDLAKELHNFTSEFIGVEPDWKPLHLVVPEKWRDGFMYMGKVGDFDPNSPYSELRQYKHGITRSYLHIGPEGELFRYDAANDKYIPETPEEAFDRVFKEIDEGKMAGLHGAMATRETPYNREYIVQRNKALADAGWTTISTEPGFTKITKGNESKIAGVKESIRRTGVRESISGKGTFVDDFWLEDVMEPTGKIITISKQKRKLTPYKYYAEIKDKISKKPYHQINSPNFLSKSSAQSWINKAKEAIAPKAQAETERGKPERVSREQSLLDSIPEQTKNRAIELARKSGKRHYIRPGPKEGKWLTKTVPPKSGDYFTVTPEGDIEFGIVPEVFKKQAEAKKKQKIPAVPAEGKKIDIFEPTEKEKELLKKRREGAISSAKEWAKAKNKNAYAIVRRGEWFVKYDKPRFGGTYFEVTPEGVVTEINEPFNKQKFEQEKAKLKKFVSAREAGRIKVKTTEKPAEKPAGGGPRLMSGFDPGIAEFIAQSVKPSVINAAKAAKTVGKVLIGLPKLGADSFLQPSLEVERKSPKAYVAVMKAIHTAQDAARLDFNRMKIKALDMNIEQARQYFNRFSDAEQRDFMTAFAGQPGTPDAALMQKEAFKRLPEELKDPKLVQAVREIAANNYEYLKKVVGPQVHWIPDYFYGVFKKINDVDKFWKHWTSTDKFTKHKSIPSVADAIMYGLESNKPIETRHKNYIDNLMAEYLGISRLDQMKQLKKELMELGSAGTKKPKHQVKKKKYKGNPLQKRAAKLADIYGSPTEALRLQRLEHKYKGIKELTKSQQVLIDELKKLEEKERTKRTQEPPKEQTLDELREKSEARDPDINLIHPEDANFFITEDPEIAPADWDTVADPVFRGAWIRPDLARLINNLTSTNKITQNAILNPIRHFNNTSRLISFFGSAFHLKTLFFQSIADSGWGGPVLHPIQAVKVFRNLPIMRRWKKIQQTPEYKRLARLGVGIGYSYEEDAAKTLRQFIEYIDRNNMIGATGKLIETGLRIPLYFQQWQFDVFVPMLKHQANLDAWADFAKKKGISPDEVEDADLIDIIKATQNIYGEMNERVYGRSATQTTGSRFAAKAPSFAEGNVRTNIDAGGKWTGNRKYTRGRRARSIIVNSLLVKRMIAIAGTFFIAGKLKKHFWELKNKEDFKDLFKIETGIKDGLGREIMVDTLDSDRDYIDLWFNLFTIRPDKALYRAFDRLGGMKSILADFVYDAGTTLQGQKIRNWKQEPIFSLADEPWEKAWKYIKLALERQKPISIGVYDQMRYKEIGKLQSFLGAIAGVRPTFSETDKREAEFLRMIKDMGAELEVIDIEILSNPHPRRTFEEYNKAVDELLNSRLMPEGFKELYGPELYRDIDKYLQNKAEQAAHLAKTGEEAKNAEWAAKILKHFDIKADQAVKLRADRKKRLEQEARQKNMSKTAEDLLIEQIRKSDAANELYKNIRLKERMKNID